MGRSAPPRASLVALAFVSLAGCRCGEEPPGGADGAPGSSSGSPEAAVKVGDRFHYSAPVPSELDFEQYPAPAPVGSVARAPEIPRLPPPASDGTDVPAATNRAVEVSLTGVSRTRTLPGLTAPEGREFIVLHTRWKNLQARVTKPRSDLQRDYTMGVGGFASGKPPAGADADELVELDVAYQVPKMEDHAWLLADGVAFPMDVATTKLHRGAPYGKPMTIRRSGETADLQLAYLVPTGAKDLAFRFFDYAYGSFTLPVEGDAKKARTSAPPANPLAQAQGKRLSLAVTAVEDRTSHAGVAAPHGWRFVAVQLTGTSLSRSEGMADIVQLDPRKYAWVATSSGHLRYASAGSVSPRGLLRFPPELHQRNELVFLVPADAALAKLSIRDGAEKIELALGKDGARPPALVEKRDGDVMEVRVPGLWRGESEVVLDLMIRNLVADNGLEVQPSQFQLVADAKPVPVDGPRTSALVHRPASPFVVPPGGEARFSLAFTTAHPPKALEVLGFKEKLTLPLEGVAESTVEPGSGDPSHQADDLIELQSFVNEHDVDDERSDRPLLAKSSARATSSQGSEPAAPPPFPDDREPNDGAKLAGALGDDRSATGQFGNGINTDVDVYRFTVTGKPSLWTLEASGAGLAELKYQTVAPSWSHSAGSVDGRAALYDLHLLPGDHYVAVRGTAKPGDGGDAYSVKLVPQGDRPEGYEAEPNDSDARAEAISFGRTHTGRTTHPGDQDVYGFSITQPEHLAITLASPPDGKVKLDIRSGAWWSALEPLTVGGTTRWEGILLPGDYDLLVRPAEPSLRSYELRVERLDPFVVTGDLEPNDDIENASQLPRSLIVSGTAKRDNELDYYLLPAQAKETELEVLARGHVRELIVRNSEKQWLRAAEVSDDRTRMRIKLPPGAPTFLEVRAGGDYTFEARFGDVRPPRKDALLPVTLEVPKSVGPFAAWWRTGQQRDLPIELHNPGTTAQTVRLRTWSSHPEWRAQLPATVSVPAGAHTSVPMKVDVPADAWGDRPVRVAIEASSSTGERRIAWVDLVAACGADVSNAQTSWSVPAALLGGLDVAATALGGKALPHPQFDHRVGHLQSGLVTLDLNASFAFHKLPAELTFDLAGDEPVPVAGFLLHPPGGPTQGDAVFDFEVLLSEDGQSFSSAAQGRLTPFPHEQAFVLPKPVPARFARLRIPKQKAWRAHESALALFKVVAAPSAGQAIAHASGGGLNLADPAKGGHIVWAEHALDYPARMLTPELEKPTYRSDPTQPARFVVGFQHERAARIRALEWQEDPAASDNYVRMTSVHLAVSTESPLGPWRPIGNWTLQRDERGLARFELPEAVWARYVEVRTLEADAAKTTVMPDVLRIFEQPADGTYRSVLGEWGVTSREAIFEQLVAPAEPRPPTHGAPHATKEQALALTLGTPHGDRIQRGVDLDWYRIDVPADRNTLRLTFQAESLSRLEWRVEDEQGRTVALELESATSSEARVRASVTPGKSYFVRLEEPPRSVVFTWDSSGSVAGYHPQIYRSLARFAAAVQPGRERVHLLPFGANQPLLSEWGSDSNVLQQAINDYDERDGSSDAEGSLRAATELLAGAKGSRAVLIITDDASGASPSDEAKLWQLLREVRPRVFSVQIPVGSEPDLYRDRMQTWASANGGHYGAFRSRADLDLAFDRATCLLRRPETYQVLAEASHETPPPPGSLVVKRTAMADSTAFEIIFDASGSMHRKLGDKTRIEIARSVLSKLVTQTLPAGTPVALRAFGHVQPRSCRTDLVVPLRPLDRQKMASIVRAIDPKDRSGTPLAASLKEVGNDLKNAGRQKVVVLVTDGEESCGGDPAAAVQELKAKGLDVRLNIVGFALGDTGQQAFERWAELGGGRYYNAGSAEELARALEQAIHPAFQVLDATGEVVGSGTVNGSSVELAPGKYSVRVLTTPPHQIDDVQIESSRERKVEVPSR